MKRRGTLRNHLGLSVIVFLVTVILHATAGSQELVDEAWQAFIDDIQTAGQFVRDNTDTDIDRAEGYRYVARQISGHVDYYLGERDATHPQFGRMPTLPRKLGWDNPDDVYLGAKISKDYVYRVWGMRENIRAILFAILKTSRRGGDRIHSDEMKFRPDGYFEIILSKEEPTALLKEGWIHWLELDEESEMILVRNVFGNWETEAEPMIQIELIGYPDPIPNLTQESMAQKLAKLGKAVVDDTSVYFTYNSIFETNALPLPTPGNPAWAGFPENYKSHCNFKLEPDEAMIIESPDSGAAYRNIQLANVWSESLDFVSRQTHLNGDMAYLNNDGVFYYVIAHEDPGIPNWLDTAGHLEGAIHMRWTFVDENDLPAQPVARIVKFEDILDELPDDTPFVSKLDRRKAMVKRQFAFGRRITPAGVTTSQMPIINEEHEKIVSWLDDLLRASWSINNQ